LQFLKNNKNLIVRSSVAKKATFTFGKRLVPDNLTHANVMDSTIKYMTLRKNKLQLLCGNLLDHIKDLKVEKAKSS
jgi:hypothetical protein